MKNQFSLYKEIFWLNRVISKKKKLFWNIKQVILKVFTKNRTKRICNMIKILMTLDLSLLDSLNRFSLSMKMTWKTKRNRTKFWMIRLLILNRLMNKLERIWKVRLRFWLKRIIICRKIWTKLQLNYRILRNKLIKWSKINNNLIKIFKVWLIIN